MKKVVFTIIVLMCSQAFGLTFMGPPKAELKQNQSSVGFDYSYGEIDIDFDDSGFVGTFENVETSTYLVNLAYGITNTWEIFALLGLTDTDYEEDFNAKNDLAYGFGTKFTLSRQDSLSFGGLFKIISAEADGTYLGFKGKFDYYEIQIAVGPTFKHEAISIYGGPFLHFIEVDISENGLTADIDQESEFGGYIGALLDINKNVSCCVEYQKTGNAHGICAGLRWKF